ncbi:ABC transporter permease [Sinorhizobium americanum]|nr:ABC transporter permease [Sinorhizobium americanum]OAP39532.1 sugar ABC transporter [Sinorhizobium americanum]
MNTFVQFARSVLAFIVREMATRYGSKPGGYLWAILDPLAHVAVMTAIFTAISRTPALGDSYPLYFGTGYMAFHMYQTMASYVSSAIRANKQILTYPTVAIIDPIVARYILQFMTGIATAIVILLLVISETHRPVDIQWLPIVEATLAASLLGLSIGLVNATMYVRFPMYENIFSLINRPMYLISGVFFLPDAMPPAVQDMVMLNPIAHLVMLFRTGFYPEYHADLLDIGYVYKCCLVLLFAGLALVTKYNVYLRNER